MQPQESISARFWDPFHFSSHLNNEHHKETELRKKEENIAAWKSWGHSLKWDIYIIILYDVKQVYIYVICNCFRRCKYEDNSV